MTRRFNSPARAKKKKKGGAPVLFALMALMALTAEEEVARAQKRPRASEGGDAARAATRAATKSVSPRFGDYPAREVYRGRIAPVIIDTGRARKFRSMLREGARRGPNFAGHYTFVFWGCGTGCAQAAVVDAKTGRIYWPPLEYTDIPDSPEGDNTAAAAAARNRNFRPDSKLLVLTRNHYDARGGHTAYYYLFDRKRFRLLRRAEETSPDSEISQPQQ